MPSALPGQLTGCAVALRVTPPPAHSQEWIRPGTQGWEPWGWAWGWAAEEGLADLPPRKWADSGALLPPGPEPSDRLARRRRLLGDLCSHLLLWPKLIGSRSLRTDPLGVLHLPRGAGPAAHLFAAGPHPCPRRRWTRLGAPCGEVPGPARSRLAEACR